MAECAVDDTHARAHAHAHGIGLGHCSSAAGQTQAPQLSVDVRHEAAIMKQVDHDRHGAGPSEVKRDELACLTSQSSADAELDCDLAEVAAQLDAELDASLSPQQIGKDDSSYFL